ncbi:hypothetical protein [Prescottella defluvii]|nr:hypothetical protein [Prescottella defluvii]
MARIDSVRATPGIRSFGDDSTRRCDRFLDREWRAVGELVVASLFDIVS